VVHVRGTRYGATADGAGRYDLAGLPNGAYVVLVRRIGFAPDSFAVTLADGERVTHDVRLRRTAAALAGVTIVASPRLAETREAALARRQEADNLVSTLSGDDIRALPNANAAEALARVPGVSTERDEGEGKFVQIRGTEPRLSNVTIDGAHVPGTESGARVPKLDDVPTDLLGAIEVAKTLSADMDADAIGGSVNLVTKTPEGAPRGYAALQGGLQDQFDRRQGQASLTYGGRFGADRRFGLLLGGTWDRNDRSIDDVEPAWSVAGARSVPVEWDARDYLYDRTRAGVGGETDYRFAGGGSVFVRGLFSEFHNYGTRYRFDLAAADDSVPAGASGVGSGATFVREVQDRTPNERLYGFTAGGQLPRGALQLDYALNWSGTRQLDRGYRTSAFAYDGPGGDGVPLRYDATDPNVPRYRFVRGADSAAALDPRNYALSRYTLSDGSATGRDVGGQVNALVNYSLGTHASSVKAGLKLRDEHKAYTADAATFVPTAPLTLDQVQSGFADPSFYHNLAGGFVLGPSPDAGAAKAWEDAHASQFRNTTNTARNALGSYTGGETVYAGYAMNTVDVGALRANVGLRAEITHASYTGHAATTPADANGKATGPAQISTVPGAQTYVDVFPSAQLRYSFGPRADVRLAVTRAIARPNYIDLAPHLSGEVCASCAGRAGNLSAGNPALKPQRAWNGDLLAERYLPGAGLLSGGVFYKRITGFIYSRAFAYAGPLAEFAGYLGTRPDNGGDADVVGAEAQYTQRFLALPGGLAGLGVDLNWTHVHSRAALLGDTATAAAHLGQPVVVRHAALPRTSPDVANLALTYDRGPVSARAAWQYQGANIYAYGDGTSTADGDTYFYAHRQIDASLLWNVTRAVQLQLQGLNLNNAVFGFYNGTPSTHYDIQREVYGRSAILGVKYGF
jgi:TonB-dependent receptor